MTLNQIHVVCEWCGGDPLDKEHAFGCPFEPLTCPTCGGSYFSKNAEQHVCPMSPPAPIIGEEKERLYVERVLGRKMRESERLIFSIAFQAGKLAHIEVNWPWISKRSWRYTKSI